ncbi:hypothetical protein VTK26DRAFT_4765 [Humicola hyalothermophila]
MSSHLTTTPSPPLGLTDTESAVLDLYDELQQLRLELAFLRAQQTHHALSGTTQAAKPEAADGQMQLLEAKATQSLTRSVVENGMIAQPTLNAVHHATHASPAERELIQYIEQRDAAAVGTTKKCTDLQAARRHLAELEVESLRASQENIRLASEVLQLSGKTRQQGTEAFGSDQVSAEMRALEDQVKAARHKWRVIKGAASAIVAGSGVEWARDERLRAMVLEPPN